MLEIGTVLQDRYKIEKQIGAGGMGAVYLAIDSRFDNYVAIKETFYKDDEIGGAFEREARLLNLLHHPVLPHVSDYFTEAGGHFLVMQYIEGEDLSEILKREKAAFPVRDVLRWTDNLLDALDYLHSQEPPIIHRDLKPQNLKLTARGDVILLDFGLAKLSKDDASSVKSVFGYSRKYSPLEQIQGTGTDARSDIFALGATVYHLATGKTPPDALTRAAAIIAGKHDPLQPAGDLNREVSPGAANVLTKALALNPERRFASAKEMRRALEKAISETFEDAPTEISGKTAAAAAEATLFAPVAVAAADAPLLADAKEEKFPALEAFAAKVGAPKTDREETVAAESSEVLLPRESPPPANASNRTAEETRRQTPVAAAAAVADNRSRLWITVGAAILSLICGSLAAFYFTSRAADSVAAPNLSGDALQQQQPANAEPENDSPLAGTISSEANLPEEDSSAQDAAGDGNFENREAARNGGENSAAAGKGDSGEKTSAASVAETSRKKASAPLSPPPAPRNARRENSPVGDGGTRSRIVEGDPLPDIESVFTGETAAERRRANRRERRRANGRMSDLEGEEPQRRRRQRRNDRRLPF